MAEPRSQEESRAASVAITLSTRGGGTQALGFKVFYRLRTNVADRLGQAPNHRFKLWKPASSAGICTLWKPASSAGICTSPKYRNVIDCERLRPTATGH